MQQSPQKFSEELLHSINAAEQNLQTPSSIPSQFYNDYQQQINSSILSSRQLQLILQKIHNITYDKFEKYSQFDFSIIEITPNFQILEAKIKIGLFSLSLLILNEQGKSPFGNIQSSKQGTFGKIYFTYYENKQIALKCLFFTQNSRSIIIAQAIKEYCILKICSLLEVSPKVDDYYGFHFVLYDDCIMFAMQRGKTIRKISNEIPLKQLLRKMHSYNIIHYDIKPQNICFSREYNKIVFIDFGFSQIVKEGLGFKTLTNFRGSPQFCGPQIRSIFGSLLAKHNVDLYNNDLICLNNTLKNIQRQQKQFEISIFQYQQSLNQAKQPNQINLQILLLYHFKYLAINNQRQILNRLYLAQNQCLLMRYGKSVLLFVKSNIFNQCIENIYYQDLKPLKHMHEYQHIKNILKLRAQHYQINQAYSEDQEPSRSLKFIFKQRITIQKSLSIMIQLESENQRIYLGKRIQFLKITDYYLSPQHQEQYLSILIDCLRFDRRNLTAKEKIQISAEFIKLIGTIQNEQIPSLQSVRLVFLYLLKYCISQPYNEWKREKILTIIMQTVILSIDIREMMGQLTEALKNLFVDWTNRLIMVLQIYNICNLGSLKHFSINTIYNHQIQIQFWIIFIQNLNKCILQGVHSENPQQTFISKLLFIFSAQDSCNVKENPTMQLKYYTNQTQNLTKITLKRIIKNYIYNQIFMKLVVKGFHKHLLQLYQEIKDELFSQYYTKNSAIHYMTSSIYRFMMIIENYQQILILSQNVENMINCSEIFNNFKFRMTTFLYSENKQSQMLFQYLTKMVNLEDKQITKLEVQNQFNNYCIQIYQLFKKILNNREFCIKYSRTIQIFYKKFQYWYNSIVLSSSTMQDIEFIMYHLSFLKILCRINPIIKIQFKLILIQMELSFKKDFQNNKIVSFQSFKYFVYAANFYHLQKNWVKSQSCYQSLFQLACHYKNMKFIIYCFRNIIVLNNLIKDCKDRLLKWLIKFYQFNLNQDTMICYFDASSTLIIHVTLVNFQEAKLIDHLYGLMTNLAIFVSSYPFLNYTKQWFQNIDCFSKIQPQVFQQKLINYHIGQIFRYNRYAILYYIYCLDIQKDINKKWSILKKIALSLDNLNVFITKKILKKYYFYIHSLEKIKRKDKTLFLRESYKYLQKAMIDKKIQQIIKKIQIPLRYRQKNKINCIFMKLKQKNWQKGQIVKIF